MMKRIHIVGSGPRTGTTLLTEVMKVCFNFDACCEHEASICVPNTEICDTDDDFILSKSPAEIHLINWGMFFDRSLYGICILRDPRDMIVSKHGEYPDTYWCSLRYWKRFKTYYQKLKNHDRFLLIRYENLVTNPNLVQKKIRSKFQFLVQHYPFSKFHKVANVKTNSEKALKGVRPIEAKGIGNWKEHLPRVKQQLHLHGDISDDLIQFGYERDKEWKKILEKVPLKKIETKTQEYFSENSSQLLKTKMIVLSNIMVEKMGFKPEKVFRPIKNIIANP